ncbi:MAG TPA: glycosyltransferase family 9 protein [Anaerolineae bacterium]|nr:glycosyltransferase family 9 protein [Anaerolineae bacterium]
MSDTRQATLGSLSDAWAAVRRLLVMRLDNIGDIILAGPALRALKENLPGVHLTLMASPSGTLAAELLPWPDEVFTWRVLWQDLGHLDFEPAREWNLVEALRAGRYDAAIILTSFSQTPHPAGLASFLAGIPLRAGESKEVGHGELTLALDPAPDPLHQVERNLRLIEALGFEVVDRQLAIDVPSNARTHAGELLTTHGVGPGEPYILLVPWTSTQARTYFPGRFGAAGRQLGDSLGWPVVVVGREADRDRAAEVVDPLGSHCVDLIGETTVPELTALVGGARVVLTGNTSTLHMADALDVPVVVIYSGTDLVTQWPPRKAPAHILRRETWCTPCYRFECPYNRECMDVAPEEVVTAALDLLSLPGVQPSQYQTPNTGQRWPHSQEEER